MSALQRAQGRRLLRIVCDVRERFVRHRAEHRRGDHRAEIPHRMP
jgi:hypothetical protein